MTIPFWCLVVVAFLPYLLAFLTIPLRIQQFGNWDNYHPRSQCARLEGVGWRLWSAQLNAWEALAFFTAAVVVAHLAGADPEKSATAAIVFMITRLLHPLLYVANLGWFRSIAVAVGLASCVYLFVLAANAPIVN